MKVPDHAPINSAQFASIQRFDENFEHIVGTGCNV